MPKNKASYLDEIANEIVQAQEQQYIATGKDKFYSVSLDYKKWHEIIVALRARAQMERGR